MNQASIAEAKDQFPRLVQQAEAGERVSITRRGHPVAVLLSVKDYERLLNPAAGNLAEFLATWRAEMREAAIPFPEVSEFEQLRDNTPGREVDLA